MESLQVLGKKLAEFQVQNPSMTGYLAWLPDDQRNEAYNALFSLNLVYAHMLREKLSVSRVPSIHHEKLQALLEESIRSCRSFPDLASRQATLSFAESIGNLRDLSDFFLSQKMEAGDPVDRLLAARLALSFGMNEAVFRALRPMPDKSPYAYLYWITLGETQLRMRRFEEAKLSLSKASIVEPDIFRAWQLCGEVDFSSGELKSAIAHYSKAIALAPRRAELYADRARVYEKHRDFDLALQDVDQALSMLPNANRLLLFRSRLHSALGRKELAAGDLDRALEHTPANESDWISRALAKSKRDPQAAMKDLEKALSMNPTSLVSLQNKAYIESEHLKDFPAAIATLTRILDIDPDFERARAGRAVLNGRIQNTAGALTDVHWFEEMDHSSLLASTMLQSHVHTRLSPTKTNIDKSRP